LGRGASALRQKTQEKKLRSKTILSSIILSASILVFSVVASQNINTYHLPFNISYNTLSKPVQQQVDCLAQNIYHEAKSESREGQVAVALVTLNRLASGNYANDVCGVVKQKTNGVCQFSWVCQPFIATKSLTSNSNSLYNDIRNVAVYVLMNYDNMNDVTKGATYYHADYVNPQWGLPKTTQIGRHIFYKRNTDLQTMKKEIKI
jgi:spore germination cell wall hydrolase CwlJ-like protein